MISIISVLVENRAGVLSRTAGMFARRGFNIKSLAVGETDDPGVSRMTIVVDGDARIIEQVGKQLNKQVDVIKVRELQVGTATRRELALIKVKATAKTRGEIMDIANLIKSRIVDVTTNTLTLEVSERPEKIEQILGLLTPYGIVEMARTGMVALPKGPGAIN